MRIVLFAILASGSMIGAAMGQSLTKINPTELGSPAAYTHVVRGGSLVFIAGQVGADAGGRLAGPGMREQTDQVLKNLQAALASQQLDFSHVAKITIFTTNVDEFRSPEVAAVRAKYFGDAKPASTLVQVVRLASPDYKVEIEAIAIAP